MKRILLAGLASLSLLVALPAISTASSGRARDHGARAGHDRGRHHDRGDRRREDRRHEARHEHFGTGDVSPAATVQSFQNGVLTIALADGSTVSGQVTPATRVACEAMSNEGDSARHDGGSNSGDNSGPGSGDNGDRGDDNGNGGNDGGDRGNANDPSCVALLQHAGTKVVDAQLNVFQGSAVWEEVELGL